MYQFETSKYVLLDYSEVKFYYDLKQVEGNFNSGLP